MVWLLMKLRGFELCLKQTEDVELMSRRSSLLSLRSLKFFLGFKDDCVKQGWHVCPLYKTLSLPSFSFYHLIHPLLHFSVYPFKFYPCLTFPPFLLSFPLSHPALFTPTHRLYYYPSLHPIPFPPPPRPFFSSHPFHYINSLLRVCDFSSSSLLANAALVH